MFSDLLANASSYIETNAWLAVAAVFVGGALTASNPCVLAMIPLMMGFVAGRPGEQRSALRAFLFSLVFVFGLAVTFTTMGMVAALAGKVYGDVSALWNWVVLAVCLVMGLHLMEVVHLPIPAFFAQHQPKSRGWLGALSLGLLFGLVSAPCAAPILVVVLTYLAGSGASVVYGGLLLLAYALGHSVLILLAGTSMGAARALIENRGLTRVSAMLRRGAGVVVILVGVFFVARGWIG